MLKIKRSLLIGSASVVGVLLCGWLGLTQTPPTSLQFTVSPSAAQLRPYEAESATPQNPTEFKVAAIDAVGHSLQAVPMRVRLQAPPRNFWYPTDFPIVEGTTLLELEAFAPDGVVQFQQMLPIRGTYSLNAEIAPANATPIQETFTLSLPENGTKYRNFAILVVVLLAIGLLGGWVIGSEQSSKPGEIAPHRVRLLLSGAVIAAIAALLLLNLSTVGATSHSHDHPHPHDQGGEVTEVPDTPTRQLGNLEATLSGDTEAIVGQLARFQVELIDRQSGQPVTDVQLAVKATALEGGWVAFAYRGVPNPEGRFAWRQQFFDGSPHRLEVEISPQPGSDRQFQPLQLSQTLDVEAVTPPAQTRLLGLAYFVSITVAGFLIGLKLHHQQPQPSYHSRL